jgi:hypothetical protein
MSGGANEGAGLHGAAGSETRAERRGGGVGDPRRAQGPSRYGGVGDPRRAQETRAERRNESGAAPTF